MLKKTLLFVSLFSVVFSQGMATSKLIIAHRGLSGTYPENTMLAFKRALDTQAQLMELDVHLSSDDQVVVIHDRDLKRTTTGYGNVDERPYSYLQRISAGYSKKFGWKYYKEKLPTLTQVLDLIEDSKITLLIEIKSHEDGDQIKKQKGDDDETPKLPYNKRVGPIVYETVMKDHAHLKDRIAFISFNTEILKEIKKVDPTVSVGPIFHEMPKDGSSLADQALALKTDVVIFNKDLLNDPHVFEKTDRVRHFVYTVDDPAEMKRLMTMKPLAGFATNYANLVE